MTIVFPVATKAQGALSVWVCTSLTDPTAPKVATELTASTSANLSCYGYDDFQPQISTNKGTSPARWCSTQQLEQFGYTNYQLPDLQYVYDPQAALTVAANRARQVLTPFTNVYLVIRRGLDARTIAPASGQYGRTFYVRTAYQNESKVGDGEFAELTITQSIIALSPPVDCIFAT